MTTALAQRVGERVHVEMRRQRTTQSDVAKHLGLSQAGVSRRLTGQVEFSVGELLAVASMLGVDAGALIVDEHHHQDSLAARSGVARVERPSASGTSDADGAPAAGASA